MYVRGRLRDLKARTKTRFKGTLLSATTSNPAGSATEAPTGPTVPASISNLPSASPSTCALAAPPVNFAGTVTEISSFTPTPESSSITISPGHAPRAWENLRALPRVLDPVAGAFGPLKAIVDELVGFLDIYERVANGRAEYSKLHYELELLCGESKQHFSHPIGPPVTTGVESLCKSIQEELDWLNVNVSIWKLAEKQIREIRSDRMSTQLDRLSLSFSAFYNSAHAMELKRGSCTPGTRVNVLNQIHSWIRNPIQGSIHWLNGMAGTGKTTIVHTLSAALDKEHKLAASFFALGCSPNAAN
ncbi:hypothetical protein B0J17DRAFT_624481 [Rhizoctonia solani]|nr:hypothetical protein B0J17DRAFT_624481 [Rhizoctonia solani]